MPTTSSRPPPGTSANCSAPSSPPISGSIPLTIGARASYSKSKRDAPYELAIGYQRSNQAASPYGQFFLNRLDNGQTGYATAAFSDLDEELLSAGVDVTMEFTPSFKGTVGYDFADTQRDSTRREFQIVAPSTFPNAVATLRPDYLLGPAVIDYFGIGLVETTETDPAFTAELRTQCGLPADAGRFDRYARPEHRRALRARTSRTFVHCRCSIR